MSSRGWRQSTGRVACKVHRTAANGVPPAAEASERHFKCLYMDVGLMCAALHLNLLDLGREDLTLVHNGAVAEQFVGQHLLHSGPSYETPALHYWAREARNSNAEVDYVIAVGRRIVPVEIKVNCQRARRVRMYWPPRCGQYGCVRTGIRKEGPRRSSASMQTRSSRTDGERLNEDAWE